MLVLENVDAHYGKSHVLHGVSIEVRAGEVVGLLGRNGVGKTTTLKTIMGMARRTAGRITFEGGKVEQSNFHDYPMARMAETPRIEVRIVESSHAMGGVGEPGVPPIAPAVANALFALTKKRQRTLPLKGGVS